MVRFINMLIQICLENSFVQKGFSFLGPIDTGCYLSTLGERKKKIRLELKTPPGVLPFPLPENVRGGAFGGILSRAENNLRMTLGVFPHVLV